MFDLDGKEDSSDENLRLVLERLELRQNAFAHPSSWRYFVQHLTKLGMQSLASLDLSHN